MNLFNRIVTTLLLLALIPIVTVGLIVPQEAVDLVRDGLDQIEERFDFSTSAGRMIVSVVIALLIDALLVFLIYLQVRRPRTQAVPMQQVEGGEAQLAVDSIVGRLAYHIDRLPGVLDVNPQVMSHRKGVKVVLGVEVAGDVNVPTTAEEVVAVTRMVIEEEMGLQLAGKPKLDLRTVSVPMALDRGEAEVDTERPTSTEFDVWEYADEEQDIDTDLDQGVEADLDQGVETDLDQGVDESPDQDKG